LRKNVSGLWRSLFTNKTLLASYWAYFVFGCFFIFFVSWLPSFLETRFHMSTTEVGFITVVPWAVSALLMWLAGVLSDAMFKKTKNLRISRTYFIFIAQAISTVAIVCLMGVSSKLLALTCITIILSFMLSTAPTFYAINIDLVKKRAATSLGVMNVFLAISSFIAPAVAGRVIESSYGYNAMFLTLAFLGLSSTILMIIFHRPDQDVVSC
jgi:MFS transporter, ACS family, hexuronate transporter